MQETIITTPDNELPPSRPRRLRFIALALALVLFAPFAYIAYQNIRASASDPPGPNGFPEPDFSLTNEEAIRTFHPLLEQAHFAVEHRDVSVLPQVFTSDSPMKARTMRTIKRLKQDGVSDKSVFKSLSIEVVRNDPQEIELMEEVLVEPCYESDAGKDVTVGPRAFEYNARWVMRLEDSRWLIHESAVEGDEKIRDDGKGSC